MSHLNKSVFYILTQRPCEMGNAKTVKREILVSIFLLTVLASFSWLFWLLFWPSPTDLIAIVMKRSLTYKPYTTCPALTEWQKEQSHLETNQTCIYAFLFQFTLTEWCLRAASVLTDDNLWIFNAWHNWKCKGAKVWVSAPMHVSLTADWSWSEWIPAVIWCGNECRMHP